VFHSGFNLFLSSNLAEMIQPKYHKIVNLSSLSSALRVTVSIVSVKHQMERIQFAAIFSSALLWHPVSHCIEELKNSRPQMWSHVSSADFYSFAFK
jgi:hypothetical protein